MLHVCAHDLGMQLVARASQPRRSATRSWDSVPNYCRETSSPSPRHHSRRSNGNDPVARQQQLGVGKSWWMRTTT